LFFPNCEINRRIGSLLKLPGPDFPSLWSAPRAIDLPLPVSAQRLIFHSLLFLFWSSYSATVAQLARSKQRSFSARIWDPSHEFVFCLTCCEGVDLCSSWLLVLPLLTFIFCAREFVKLPSTALDLLWSFILVTGQGSAPIPPDSASSDFQSRANRSLSPVFTLSGCVLRAVLCSSVSLSFFMS
jgi:hypothetical protein